MTHFTAQVSKDHYQAISYDTKDRWVSYWYQARAVMGYLSLHSGGPGQVLEIGPGNKTVGEALKKQGITVTTADIAEDLNPDVVSSVTDLPFPDNSFDGVLAAEVLEHLPFDDVPLALAEIRRVARRFAVVSLPHAGYVFSCEFKVPLMRRREFIRKLPFFWKKHAFNGEHYWELGTRGYSVARIKKMMADAGFAVRESQIHADDPSHCFFLLEKFAEK